MARIKANYMGCKNAISLLITEDEDIEAINNLADRAREYFEHKCLICETWTVFQPVE